ncbi:GIP, partial [Symbiodinium sp. CCMP2592]
MWAEPVYHMYMMSAAVAPDSAIPDTLEKQLEQNSQGLPEKSIPKHFNYPDLSFESESVASEEATVMSLETALVASVNGARGFVLDTGATENAVGVKTLEQILMKAKIKHTVSIDERPVFKFGDGLSLRASLGDVHFYFYTLDGDHRPQTHNAENTPALLGGKFLREARATISCDLLCLWFADSRSTLWATELLQTQSGHLMIPVSGQLLDMNALRLKAEREHGVRLPFATPCLLDLLLTPGALEELKQAPLLRVFSQFSVSVKELIHHMCVPCLRSLSDFVTLAPASPCCDSVVHMALARASTRRAAFVRISSQFASWMACCRCGLRLHDEPKMSHGKDRTAGATVEAVKEAIDELAEEFPDGAVTEKMCAGKIREVQGRRMVRNEKVVLHTFMEKKAVGVEPRGATVTRAAGQGNSAEAEAEVPTDRAPAIKTKKDPSLEGPGEQGGGAEGKAGGRDGRRFRGLGPGALRKDEHCELEGDKVIDDEVGVEPGGVERNLDEDHTATATPTAGLAERSRGFTGATRRQLHVAGAPAYFASLLCTTTVLLNLFEKASLMEVNGANSEGNFGSMAGDLGITYDGYFQKSGWMVEKKNVSSEIVSRVVSVMPEMLWISPAVRGETPYGTMEAPGVKRNRQRAQRRSLEVAAELSKGACQQIREGRHVAWEVWDGLYIALHHIIVDGCFYKKAEGAHGKRWRGTSQDTAKQVGDYLLESSSGVFPSIENSTEGPNGDQDGHILAVSTGRLPTAAPTGAKLKQIKDSMLRLHRGLTCDGCSEVRRQAGPPAASAEPPPSLWEVLGMDVFEVEYKKDGANFKAKVLLMISRASRFTMTHVLKEFAAEQSWEPSAMDVKRAVVRTWLGSNPGPRWIITDAAPSFTSREMLDFASRSGLGLLTAPAEAHYIMGIEERAIQVIKRAIEKLEKEDLELGIESPRSLACHGHNSFIHATTGYRKKLSKLSNSVSHCATGDLCMLWRTRVN